MSCCLAAVMAVEMNVSGDADASSTTKVVISINDEFNSDCILVAAISASESVAKLTLSSSPSLTTTLGLVEGG